MHAVAAIPNLSIQGLVRREDSLQAERVSEGRDSDLVNPGRLSRERLRNCRANDTLATLPHVPRFAGL